MFTNGFPCLRGQKASEMICITNGTTVQIERSWMDNPAKSIAARWLDYDHDGEFPPTPFSGLGFGNFTALSMRPATFYKLAGAWRRSNQRNSIPARTPVASSLGNI